MTLPNIPTAVSAPEARFMRGRRVIEFGALLGFSTVVLAQEAAFVASIDRHEGYGGRPTLRPYMVNLERYNVLDRVEPIVADATRCAHLFWGDLVMIDLLGTYDLTKTVLSRLPSGLALIHDFQRSNCNIEPAVHDAGWEPVQQVETLLLARRRFGAVPVSTGDNDSGSVPSTMNS